MATYQYEKYVGYDRHELKYKKVVTIDNVTGNESEIYEERTLDEVIAYKQQKESEFNDMKATWERLGIKKCAWERVFDDKKFNKIYLNLIDGRLKELAESNQTGDIETNMLNSIDDVYKKYNIGAAFKYYSVKDPDYASPSKLFKGLSKSKIEKLFYSKMTTEAAGISARNKLAKSSTIEEGVAVIQQLKRIHDSRSIFYKIFHPVKNAAENNLIKEIKAEVMQKFNISAERLNDCLKVEIDVSKLQTANLYKIDDFVNTYCKENAGKLYSQRIIDEDRQDVADRADAEFVDAQTELDKINSNEMRESIVVDDAKNNDEVERDSQPVREDPLIIKVPNNDKF